MDTQSQLETLKRGIRIMGMYTADGVISSPTHTGHPTHITSKEVEEEVMETVLLAYCVVCWVVVAAIMVCTRHDIVMVHLRNPIKYSMEKIYIVCFALFIAAPVSIYWLLYEVWDDKK